MAERGGGTMQGRFLVLFAVVGVTCMSGMARAETGTPITLSTALTFQTDISCDHSPESPCFATGTFEANDQVTADLICASGTLSETHWFPRGRRGPFTIAERTWTCPDGSTLVMRVLRWVFIPLTDTTAQILQTWIITGGSGRLADLNGRGTLDEVFAFPPTDTLSGTATGFVH
jgi:hypothetical protein